jgi:filamentous hemagglutinin
MKIKLNITMKVAVGSVLAGVVPVAPLWHAGLAQVTADPNAPAANRPSTTTSLNGTPVQNIVAPNASGLSHNKLQDFNVGKNNLIINNSSVNAVSQTGGAVVGNPNLAQGSATIILNEVTSGNRSSLQGTQELLGQRAAYILANPNGITCDGCGFINFPRVTLSTGVPVINNGVLSSLLVNGGDVTVGAGGINATGADFFDILTRSLVLGGQINANDLTVMAGRASVDYASLVATALAADGSKAPAYAIDSSALGGMYAGRIALVGTEAGLGVRLLGNVAASTSDVTLDVNGQILLKDMAISAERDIRVKSTQAAATAGKEIETSNATLYAKGNVGLVGGDVQLTGGRVGAGQDVTIQASSYTDSGVGKRDAGNKLSLNVAGGAVSVTNSLLQANQQLSVTAASMALLDGAKLMAEADKQAVSGALGSLLVSLSGDLSVTKAALFSGGAASVSAGSLTVDSAGVNDGTMGLRSTGALTVNVAGKLTNIGTIAGDAGLSVTAATVDNRAGALMQGGASAPVATTIVASTSLINAGNIGSSGSLSVQTASLNNNAGGEITAGGALSVTGVPGAAASSLTNAGAASIKGQSVTISLGTVNNSGSIYGTLSLGITAQQLSNLAGGKLSTLGALSLQQSQAGGTLSNAADILGGSLSLNYSTLTQSQALSKLYGKTAASLTVGTLNNKGQVLSDGTLSLNSSGALGSSLDNSGTLDALNLDVNFGTITNSGTLYAASKLGLSAASLTNQNNIESGGSMDLVVTKLSNQAGNGTEADILAAGNLSISGNNTLVNASSTAKLARIVSSGGTLTIDSRSGSASESVENNGGFLFGQTGLSIWTSRQFLNQYAAGRRAITFANSGSLNLGLPTQAAVLSSPSSVLVRNVDSQIENSTGDINIITTRFENTTADYTPVKVRTLIETRTSGTFDYDGTLDGTGDMLDVYGNCGQNADHFDDLRVGYRCANSVKVYEEQLTNPNTAPRSSLIAGRDINLYVKESALNYISIVSANRNITVSGAPGATFENRAVSLLHEEVGQVYRYDAGGVSGDPVGCDNGCFYGYDNGSGPDDLVWHFKVFTDISLATAPSYRLYGVPSVFEAGNKLTINVSTLLNTNSQPATDGQAPVNKPSSQSGAAPTNPNLSATIATQTVGTTPLAAINALSTSPFFQPSKNPTSPYLFETDPRLMSLAGLYGSDLFLKALGLDPTQYLRVGDPYYEQQLLRQQLLSQAGQRFILDGLVSENDQFKQLMENGIAARDTLQLRLGVALTPEQVASLQKDVVWMVETEVNGKKVLVPQLYMADSTRAWLASGAKLSANDLEATAAGPINNSGAIVARDSITLDSGSTFTNRLGSISAGQDLSITAHGDVLNQSGRIQGGNVNVASTQGSVVNETLTREVQVTGATGTGTNTVVGDTATIAATKTLNINAGKDISSRGGDLSAGQDATLNAVGNVKLEGIEKKSYTDTRTVTQSGGYTTDKTEVTRKTEVLGSNLKVGNDLSVKAGNDVTVSGSNVDVKGNASLDAGRDVVITAAAEQTSTQRNEATKSWNSRATENTAIDQTTGKAATLNVGGNLNLASGRDTNIKGSDVGVGGDLNVNKVGGNLNVSTFEEKTKVTSTTSSSTIFGGEAKATAGDNITKSKASAAAVLFSNSTETTTIDSTTNRGSDIQVGGSLNAAKGAIKGDANITGSNVSVGKDLNLAAGGNVNVLAATDTTTVTNTSTSNKFTLGGEASIDGAGAKFGYDRNEANGSATQKTAKTSSLNAGQNIDINAGKDFTEQGSKVEAGGAIGVEANRINSLAAKDSFEQTGDSLSVSASLGVKAETGLGAVVGSFIDKKGNASFNMAQASESIASLNVPDAGSAKAELSVSVTKTNSQGSGTTAKASSFNSGDDISFTAREGDATFEGTQVKSGGSIAVTADKGSVKIGTADSKSASSTQTTNADVTIGVSGDGTISGSGSGGNSTESAGATGQQAASFTAARNINVTAQKDVTLVGTALDAGQNASIEAKEGKIDFAAARATTDASTSGMTANASFSANVTGKEGSIGGGGGTSSSSEQTSTGTAGSIKGSNVSLKSKGDIALEGTKIQATHDTNIETEGKLDFKALEDTKLKTKQGTSAQVDLEAGVKSAGGKVAVSKTDEFEQSSTKTAGSISTGNLTIKTGQGVRLEGTDVKATQDANIDAGAGKLVLESAVSTSTKRVNNTDVAIGAKGDAKSGAGQGSFSLNGAYEDTAKTTNQNAKLDIGGKADLKAAGGIEVKGSNLDVAKGITNVVTAGSLNTNGATVSTEQRTDVDRSSRTDVGFGIGVIVPDKKTRKQVADTAAQVRDSKAANTVSNKLESAGTALSNTAASAKAKLANTASDIKTTAKNLGADEATRKTNNEANAQTKSDNNRELANTVLANKNAATDKKLANNTAYADKKAAAADTRMAAEQKKSDQKAQYDQQKADKQATAERDKALAAIDTTQDAKAQDAVKQKIESDFAAKKQANADTFDAAVLKNAQEALTAKSTYADKTATRQEEALNKAATSQVQHQDDAATTRVALADQQSNAKAKDAAKNQAESSKLAAQGQTKADQVLQVATVKAEAAQQKAVNTAQAKRLTDDAAARTLAAQDIKAAQDKLAKDNAALDADATLSAAQRLDKQNANTKQAEQTIKQAQAKLDDTLTANEQAVSKASSEAQKTYEQALAKAQADKDKLQAQAHVDSRKLVPDSTVRLTQKKADATFEADRKKAEAERTAAVVKLDTDKAEASKKAAAELADAKKKLDPTKDADKPKLAKLDAEHADKLKQIDAQYKKDVEAADTTRNDAIKTADAQRDQTMADAMSDLGKRLDAAQTKRNKEIDTLQKDRDALATFSAKQREDLATARAKADDKLAAIAADKKLTDVQKAQQMLDARTQAAKDEVALLSTQAKARDDKQHALDDAAKKLEIASIDRGLSKTERDAARQAINDKYAERRQARQDATDAAITQAKADSDRSLAQAKADHAIESARAQAYADAKEAELKDRKAATAALNKAIKDVDAQAKLSPEEKATLKLELRREAQRKDIDRIATREKAEAQADTAVQKTKLQNTRDEAVAQADQAKQDANDALAKEVNLSASQKAARQKAIDATHAAAVKRADDQLAAQTKKLDADETEQLAAIDLKQHNAAADAGLITSAKAREAQLEAHAQALATKQGEAQAKRNEASTDLAKLIEQAPPGVGVPAKPATDAAPASQSLLSLSNKADAAATSLANTKAALGTKLANALGDLSTSAKNLRADDATAQTNRNANQQAKAVRDADLQRLAQTSTDAATARKLAKDTAFADQQAARAQAKVLAEQGRQDAQALSTQQKADKQALAERDKALAAIDTTQDPKAQAAAKQKIQADHEARLQASAQTLDTARAKNAADALSAQSANADKAAQRKAQAHTEAGDPAQATVLLAQATQTKAENTAQAKRLTDDAAARNQASQDTQAARTKQAQDDAKVDADTKLSAAERLVKKKENAEVADKSVRQAQADLDKALNGHAQDVAKASSEAQVAFDKARNQAQATQDIKQTEAELARRKEVPDPTVKQAEQAAQAAFNTARDQANTDRDAKVAALNTARQTKVDAAKADLASKRAKLDPTKDADQVKQLDKAHADALAKIDTDHKAELAKASTARDDAIKTATTTRDKTVADAMDTMGKDLDKAHVERLKELGDLKQAQDTLADQAGQDRQSLLDARAKVDEQVVKIQADGALSADDKARQIGALRKQAAADEAKLISSQAKAQQAEQKKIDARARKLDLNDIDPRLSQADQDKAKQAIDDKYARRQQERQATSTERRTTAITERKRVNAETVSAFAAQDTLEQARKDVQKAYDGDTTQANKDLAAALKEVDSLKHLSREEKAKLKLALREDAQRAQQERVATRDKAVAQAEVEAQKTIATAQRDRELKAADSQRDSDLAALKQNTTLKPEQKKEAEAAIQAAHKDAVARADAELSAQDKRLQAQEMERTAAIERRQQDADVDAGLVVSTTGQGDLKATHAQAFADKKGEAQRMRDEADATLATLRNAQEQKAFELEKAMSEGRVKNPFSVGVLAREYGVRARRWKNVLSAFGLYVRTARLPVKPKDPDASTLADLLPIAQQFQTGDQALALRVLNNKQVRTAAVVTGAVAAIRDEAKRDLRRTITGSITGNNMGVLPIEGQKKALTNVGLLPAGELTPAQVKAAFEAYLDASVADVQPTVAQKKTILQGIGLTIADDKTDEYIEVLYNKQLTDGQAALTKVVTQDLKLSPARAQQLSASITP